MTAKRGRPKGSKNKTKKKQATTKTVEAKHAVIHNTINIHNDKKPTRKRATKPKAQPKDTSALYKPESRETLRTTSIVDRMTPLQRADHKQLMPYEQLEMERKLYHTNNPDRYGEQQNQGLIYPASYPQVHSQLTPPVAPLPAPNATIEQEPANEQDEPTAPITNFPHIQGSATQLAKQVIENYGEMEGAEHDRIKTYVDNDGKRWTQTALKQLGANGMRQFIHDNNMVINPVAPLTKKSKAEKKKAKKQKQKQQINDNFEEELMEHNKMLKKQEQEQFESHVQNVYETLYPVQNDNMTKAQKVELLFEKMGEGQGSKRKVANLSKSTWSRKSHGQIDAMLKKL